MVKLQQDNHDKLGVKIPKQEIEQVIKKHMRYRNTGRFNSYLDRLYSEGSTKFDAFIAKVHPIYGV